MARKIVLKDDGLSNSGDSVTGYRFLGYDGTSLSEKSGSSVNTIGSTTNYAIGEVKQGFISEALFQSQMGSEWVLADGRDVTGSQYHTITGITTIPDTRGQFLRGKNNGRSDGKQNPDGDVVLGTQQDDTFKEHSHSVVYNSGGTVFQDGTKVFSNGGNTWANPTGLSSSTTNMIDNTGGNETRPKNVTINYFIKIN